MLSLRELQVCFAAAVLDNANAAIGTWVYPDGLDPGARVNIYRNNSRRGFAQALALEFPVIQRLVGEEYFEQLAGQFQAEHPSRAGDLQPIGAPFAACLRERFTDTEYSYLPDVAALEWAWQAALLAADATAWDPAPLRSVPPEKLASLRFELLPACRLVHSPFPIVRIWLANQEERDGSDVIDLRAGADHVVVHRRSDSVEFHRLPAADFAFLQALQLGRTLGDALERAQRVSVEFDLARALRELVGLGVFAAMHLN